MIKKTLAVIVLLAAYLLAVLILSVGMFGEYWTFHGYGSLVLGLTICVVIFALTVFAVGWAFLTLQD